LGATESWLIKVLLNMKFIIVSVLFLLVTLSGCSSVSSRALELQGKQVPFTSFTLMQGGYLVTDELQGRVTVIAFWASWCSRSKQSIVKLNDIARRYAHRDDLVFVAVSLDSERDFGTLQKFIAEQKLQNLTHAFSGEESLDRAFRVLRGEHIPYVVILDRATRVVSISHSEKEVERLLVGR